MKKHIANVITGSRAVFSLPLLLISLSSAWFYALYFFCALTDMIDGTVARKMGAAGKFGAGLDTASDFIFMLVCCVKIANSNLNRTRLKPYKSALFLKFSLAKSALCFAPLS